MVEYRAFLCEPCTKARKCIQCGCATPSMFYAPLKKDPLKMWPSILNEEAWVTFKKEDPQYKKYSEIVSSTNEHNNRPHEGLLGIEPKPGSDLRKDPSIDSNVGDHVSDSPRI